VDRGAKAFFFADLADGATQCWLPFKHYGIIRGWFTTESQRHGERHSSLISFSIIPHFKGQAAIHLTTAIGMNSPFWDYDSMLNRIKRPSSVLNIVRTRIKYSVFHRRW
jgi:hypothetical protein